MAVAAADRRYHGFLAKGFKKKKTSFLNGPWRNTDYRIQIRPATRSEVLSNAP